jgi:hypothetical protein
VTSIVRKLDAKMTPGCFRWRRGKRVFEATMYLTGDREVMLQVVEMSIILWNGRNCSVSARSAGGPAAAPAPRGCS